MRLDGILDDLSLENLANTLFGFLGLTGAILLGTQRLGLSLAYSIISVFLVSVSLVPAIMALRFRKEDQRRAQNAP